jgi:hypothetical protein
MYTKTLDNNGTESMAPRLRGKTFSYCEVLSDPDLAKPEYIFTKISRFFNIHFNITNSFVPL